MALPAVPALVAQLKEDRHKEARETAARALGRIGKAVKTNRDAEEALPGRRQGRRPGHARGRPRCPRHDGPGRPRQVAALRKYLHHDDALARMKACHALGMLGTAARAAAPEIVAVLEKETDSHRRGYIARSLGSTGDPRSLPALYKALAKETDEGAKGEMRGAIASLGGKLPK